ncbi:MAG: rod shape-determining protein MreC [Parvularcula sp.]|jgi:rod shape-determining protein MreC|nr:rod shape-determining protein MreC [Parvularcula sp.]
MDNGLFGKGTSDGFRRAAPPPANLLFMLALSFCFTVFSIYGAQASVFEKARETLLDRFAPVLSLFSGPVRFTQNRIGDIGDYFAVVDENKRLREENEQLRIWMHQALALEERIVQYEALLAPKIVEPTNYISAQVIAENGGPFSRALVLSAGRREGVKRGFAVIDGAGLIGHVVTVGNNASRVLLLTDANSHVPVYIEAVDAEGLLSGTAESRAEIRQFASRPRAPLEVGMRVVTSGTGGTLPRGLPVGEVVRVTENGAEVDLYASEQAAHFVRVVDYTFPTPSDDAPDENEEPEAVTLSERADG